MPFQNLIEERREESSEVIRNRILECRKRQETRYQGLSFSLNAHMKGREIKQFAKPDSEGRILIEKALKELHLSARAYFKILKIARTIADLAGKEQIKKEHIAEAIQYRSLDRQH